MTNIIELGREATPSKSKKANYRTALAPRIDAKVAAIATMLISSAGNWCGASSHGIDETGLVVFDSQQSLEATKILVAAILIFAIFTLLSIMHLFKLTADGQDKLKTVPERWLKMIQTIRRIHNRYKNAHLLIDFYNTTAAREGLLVGTRAIWPLTRDFEYDRAAEIRRTCRATYYVVAA